MFDSETGEVVIKTTTDSSGKVPERVVPVGNYTITVTDVPDGYTPPDDQDTLVEENQTTKEVLIVEQDSDSDEPDDEDETEGTEETEVTTPTPTSTPQTSTGTTTTQVKTGDSINLTLWISLMVIAATGIVGMLIFKKEEE